MLTGHNSTLTLCFFLPFYYSSAMDTGKFYKFEKDKVAMVSIVGEIE